VVIRDPSPITAARPGVMVTHAVAPRGPASTVESLVERACSLETVQSPCGQSSGSHVVIASDDRKDTALVGTFAAMALFRHSKAVPVPPPADPISPSASQTTVGPAGRLIRAPGLNENSFKDNGLGKR